MRFDDPAHLRRIILRIMLGALAASAAIAVIGVLGTGFNQTAQMVGTGVSAVVTSGLLLAACKLLDFEKWRRAGLLLMAVILAEFVLVLIFIWDPIRSAHYEFDEALGFMALLFPVCALPAVLFYFVRQFRGGQLTGLLGIAMCVISYIIFLCAIWSLVLPTRDPYEEMLWGTGWASWFFGLCAAASAGGIGKDRRFWRWIGLAAAVVAYGLGLYSIWQQDDQSVRNPLVILATLAVLIAHANVMWLCKLKPSQNWLRWGTFSCACLAGAFLDYAVIRDFDGDIVWRIPTAAGICAGCGTVAVAILTAFNRRMMPVAGGGVDAKEIALVCPVCHKKQNVAINDGIGESACAGCGMIISVRLRPPRCPACDYNLLMLKSDRCPECGMAIAGPLTNATPLTT